MGSNLSAPIFNLVVVVAKTGLEAKIKCEEIC